MIRAARAVIDLRALRHNFQRVREQAPGSRVMAVVKADAYGHGMMRVARALSDADGFAVACMSEALQFRQYGFGHALLSLQGFKDSNELKQAAELGVAVCIHNHAQLQMLQTTPLNRPVKVWLKLDTGMHRLGFLPQQCVGVYERITSLPQVDGPPVLMTHFACADDRNDPRTWEQIEVFDQAVTGLAGEHSLANSAAIQGWPESHREWVRPGLMLYGASPNRRLKAEDCGLQPVMTFKAPIISIRHCRRGDAIGYGGAWVCPDEMAVGVVAAGYADGYPRHAPNGTPVLVNGSRGRLVGRVSMDMITIDLRGVANVELGDEVTLWGRGLAIEEVAECAGTISYELLCSVGGRGNVEIVERTESHSNPEHNWSPVHLS